MPQPSERSCFPATLTPNSSTFYLVRLSSMRLGLPVARELELSSVQNLDHMLPILHLNVDGHDALTRVNPGHCALWLSAGHHTPDWSLSAQAWRALMKMVWEK